jgi:hypothetical protein
MPENIISTSAGEAARPGQLLRLVSLAPKFEPSHHQIYVDLLQRALEHDSTRNVALTGAYGTGKSSVLAHLQEDEKYTNRIVRLSLSTIAPRDRGKDHTDEADDSPTSRVNQIQKEIVKQLLYRTAPRDVAQSRYRRATVPRSKKEFTTALVFGLAIAGLLFLLGPLQPLISSLFAETWRQVLVYVIVAGLSVLVTWTFIVITRMRPVMSASVNATITTVTLTKQSDTYFDAYLDEIVYFFEATKCDIVVIEDIDRFEDAQVFDTLRALNGLLNNSGQIGRRVVFVYAIRDSVFEKIGATEDLTDKTVGKFSDDHAKEALKRASRTKFFDVIIPVVPFISPDNARDVLSKAMKSDDFKISPGLIRLAARHVPDMRMIYNIRNEFEVYRDQLVISKKSLPDITDDLVFAIVLFKNTHLADYEKIRHRDSSLDRLYELWRDFVAVEAPLAAARLSAHRSHQHVALKASARAQQLGRRLLQLRDDLNEAVPSTSTMSLDEDVEANLGSLATWAQIAANDEVTLSLTRNNGVVTPFTLTGGALERLLGDSVDPAEWEEVDADEAVAQASALEEKVDFLRHHTWTKLCARPDISVEKRSLNLTAVEESRLAAFTDNDNVKFSDLVSAILSSEIARELVRHGYLTAHFALYASKYYGKHLSEEAREYIYRCIGPGEPDANFGLKRRDVRQILREQQADKDDHADLFSDASILNVNIVDYLLAERPVAAATVAAQIAAFGDGRLEFLNAYMTQGSEPGALLAHLASSWPGVIEFATTSETIPATGRVQILNSILRKVRSRAYVTIAQLGRLLDREYRSMDAVTSPASLDHASAVLGLMSDAGGSISDLSPLNADARTAAVTLQLFPVTEANMRILIPRGRVTLAALRLDVALYTHVLKHLRDYLELVQVKPSSFGVANDSDSLAALMNDLSGADSDLYRLVLSACPSDVRIDNLTSVPSESWPAIVSSRRTLTTFANVATYVAKYGVNSQLVVLLKGRRVFVTQPVDREQRTELAYALLRANEFIPSTLARVQTAASINPGVLDPALLTPESGDLVARLVKGELLADDATTFSSTLMVDWVTIEKTIKASRAFKDFVSPSLLPVEWVPALVRSTVVQKEERLAVISNLESYLATATAAQAREIAAALIEGGWRIRPVRILALYKAGAASSQIIALVANHGDALALDEARQVLIALGADYERVAVGGSGRPKFTNNPAHRKVLERFVGDTVRRVKEENFRRIGVRLVAQLM